MAEGQPAGKLAAIGFVSERVLSPRYLDALRGGLAERGWIAVSAAAPLSITLEEIGVFEAAEFGDAFKRIGAKRLDALFVPGDAMFSHHRARLVALAGAARPPTGSSW